MDITELLLEAGNLMLVGMISVFLFLSLLIIIVKSVAKYCPPDQPSTAARRRTVPQPCSASALNPKLIAAITSAVQQYRDHK